jgi:hypothetical protein
MVEAVPALDLEALTREAAIKRVLDDPDDTEEDWEPAGDPACASMKDMFMAGKGFVTPQVRGWRRITLKLLLVQDYVQKMKCVDAATDSRVVKVPGHTADPKTCPHPICARVKGGNRYGTYVHCRACGHRLVFDRNSSKKSAAKDEEGPHEVPQKPKNRGVSFRTAAAAKEAPTLKPCRAPRAPTTASSSSLMAEEVGKAVAQNLTPALATLTMAIQQLTVQQQETLSRRE